LAGVGLAVIGAVTVVLASNGSDVHLDYDSLLKAIKQIPFIVFSGIYVVAAIVLATLSRSSMGRRWVFIDVGLCAIFGTLP
jgi:magnesium transporter